MQQHGAADVAKAPAPQQFVDVKGGRMLPGSKVP
jgi:hypothetical protein